jgi:ribosomal protein L11 methyltransferase
MLEGLPPNNAAHMMTLACPEEQARAIADLIVEMFDPAEAAASAFEREPNTKDWNSGEWLVEAYFGVVPDEAYVRSLVASVAGDEVAKAVAFSTIDSKDWIAASLEGLAPVHRDRSRARLRHRPPRHNARLPHHARLAAETPPPHGDP